MAGQPGKAGIATDETVPQVGMLAAQTKLAKTGATPREWEDWHGCDGKHRMNRILSRTAATP